LENINSAIVHKIAEKMRDQVKCPHLCGSECCAPEWDSRGDQAVHMRTAYYKAAEQLIEFYEKEKNQKDSPPKFRD
jgi:hypothetical protein